MRSFRLLGDARLRRFFTAQGAGQVGDAIAALATAQVVVFDLDRGASAAELVRLVLLTSLPFFVAGPIAGVLADRCNRRRTLAVAATLRAALMACAITVPITGRADVAYVLVGLLLSVSRVLYTTRAAALPHLTTRAAMVDVDALGLQTGMAAGLIGAGIGAALVHLSAPSALLVAAALNAVSATRYRALDADLGGHVDGRAAVRAPHDELRREAASLRNPKVRFAIVNTGLHRMLFGAVFVVFVLAADARYSLEASGYAAALAVTTLGGLVATFTAPTLARRLGPRRLAVTAHGVAGASTIVAWSVGAALLQVLAVATIAWGFQNLRLLADALVQTATDDEVLGRVFAVYDVIYNTAFACGAIGVVLFTDHSPSMLLLPGCAYLAVAASQVRPPAGGPRSKELPA